MGYYYFLSPLASNTTTMCIVLRAYSRLFLLTHNIHLNNPLLEMLSVTHRIKRGITEMAFWSFPNAPHLTFVKACLPQNRWVLDHIASIPRVFIPIDLCVAPLACANPFKWSHSQFSRPRPHAIFHQETTLSFASLSGNQISYCYGLQSTGWLCISSSEFSASTFALVWPHGNEVLNTKGSFWPFLLSLSWLLES